MSSDTKPAHPPLDARRALAFSVATGLLAALTAGFFMVRYEREVSGGARVAILRLVKPVERGALLADDMLVEASVPASYLEGRAVRAADRSKVRGIRAANALETQDALLWSDLAISQEHRDLSALVQPGSRAVTTQAVIGHDGAGGSAMIRPGDYVDVLATLSPSEEGNDTRSPRLVAILLLQRVLVLAVGAITDPQVLRGAEQSALGEALNGELTLSLKVEEAQLLALARERGRLSVILRQPDDTRIIEGAPELPVSSLYDASFRTDIQRRRSPDQRPVRLAASVKSP